MAGAGQGLPGSPPGTESHLRLPHLLTAAWLLISGSAQAQTWFPVDARSLREHPVHIRVQIPEDLTPYVRAESVRRSADLLGHTLELTHDEVHPGFTDGVLSLRLLDHEALQVEDDDGLRTANSNEDGTFWVCLPAMERLWDDIGWRYPDLTREEALANKITFAVKHEIFVHLVGLAVETRRAIFRMDNYEALGYLDSAAHVDTFYDRPSQLRPDHPYILWRKR